MQFLMGSESLEVGGKRIAMLLISAGITVALDRCSCGEQGCDAEELGCVQGSTDLEALGEGSDIHDATEGDGTVSDQACECVPGFGLTSTNLLRIRNRCELGTVEPASLGSGEIREFGDDFIEF